MHTFCRFHVTVLVNVAAAISNDDVRSCNSRSMHIPSSLGERRNECHVAQTRIQRIRTEAKKGIVEGSRDRRRDLIFVSSLGEARGEIAGRVPTVQFLGAEEFITRACTTRR